MKLTNSEIKEFIRLFKIPIDIFEHFEYYIDFLSETDKFSDIKEKLKQYYDYLSFLKIEGYELVSYKMSIFKNVVDFLKETNSYKKINEYKIKNYNKLKFFTDNVTHKISIDIKEANFSVFKKFDNKNEIENTYEKLLNKFDRSNFLHLSKSFRQYIFGNLNPKKLQKIQDYYTYLLSNEIVLKNNEKVLFKQENDELILNYHYITDNDLLKKDILKYSEFEFKIKKYTEEKIGKYVLKTYDTGKKELTFVSKNRFFLEYDKFINKKNFDDIDERNLLFLNDKKKAKWVE